MKYVKSVTKYLITLAIALALLFYVFRDINLPALLEKLKKADFTFVYLSIVLSLISHFLRGYRWTLLLRPIGYEVQPFRSFIAVMVGYFANLLVPRMGEVTRCAILKKTDNIPVPASFGSVIAERLLDLIILILLIFSTLIIEFRVLKNFIYKSLNSAYASFDLNAFLIGAGMVILIFLVGSYFIFQNKTYIKSHGIYKKVRPVITDLLSGINSIRKVKNKTGFFVSTMLIWVLYFAMSYVIIFSFAATSSLGLSAGLSILMAGGLGMTAPVQGGIGTYHAFVSGVLFLYGISKEDGVLFATLLHTSQFFSILLFGGISFIISMFLRKSNGNKSQNNRPEEAA